MTTYTSILWGRWTEIRSRGLHQSKCLKFKPSLKFGLFHHLLDVSCKREIHQWNVFVLKSYSRLRLWDAQEVWHIWVSFPCQTFILKLAAPASIWVMFTDNLRPRRRFASIIVFLKITCFCFFTACRNFWLWIKFILISIPKIKEVKMKVDV